MGHREDFRRDSHLQPGSSLTARSTQSHTESSRSTSPGAVSPRSLLHSPHGCFLNTCYASDSRNKIKMPVTGNFGFWGEDRYQTEADTQHHLEPAGPAT